MTTISKIDEDIITALKKIPKDEKLKIYGVVVGAGLTSQAQ